MNGILIIINHCGLIFLFFPRFVAQQVAGGAGRVHQVPQHGEAAALPQHDQEHPRQHRQPGLPHVP